MKLDGLIEELQELRRRLGNIDMVILDGEDEFDLDHIWSGWSKPFQHHYGAICTGNHTPPEPEPDNEPERDEPPTFDVSACWDGGLHNRPMDEHDKRL